MPTIPQNAPCCYAFLPYNLAFSASWRFNSLAFALKRYLAVVRIKLRNIQFAAAKQKIVFAAAAAAK